MQERRKRKRELRLRGGGIKSGEEEGHKGGEER